jgi:pilus assembly protein Flp/PilA
MVTNLTGFLQTLMSRISWRDETGQALVEYGLLVGLIAAVCVGIIAILGGDIAGFFSSIANAL